MSELITGKEISRINLEKMQFEISKYIPESILGEARIDISETIKNEMKAEIRFFLYGKEIKREIEETYSYPRDWWQAFKERWYPGFLKKQFPVKYRKVDKIIRHFHICPHLNIASKEKHLEFLMGGR